MNNWPSAGWRDFLANRLYLYEVIEACVVFPQLGSPTQFLGLNRQFSDWVCAEIDKGLALWRLWYTARANEQQKTGKSKWEHKYKTLDEVLGITEAKRRGWDTGRDEDSREVSEEYKAAVLSAMRSGSPLPDVAEWLEQRDEETVTGVT